MRRFGRLAALWMPFYSRDIYREAAGSWKGIGLLHLALLLALCWAPSAVRWFLALKHYAAAEGRESAAQLPAIRIENGIMSADPPGRHAIPWTLGEGEDDTLLVVIDDTVDEIPADLTEQAVVLTRRQFGTIRPSRNERRVWELTSGADREVTPEDVQSFLISLQYWVPPLGYLLCLGGSLIFRTLQVLLYGAIGRILAKRWNARLDYPALVRLAALAITPVVVLRTAIWFFPSEPPWYLRWPGAIAVTLFYLVMGIRAAAGAPAPQEGGAV